MNPGPLCLLCQACELIPRIVAAVVVAVAPAACDRQQQQQQQEQPSALLAVATPYKFPVYPCRTAHYFYFIRVHVTRKHSLIRIFFEGRQQQRVYLNSLNKIHSLMIGSEFAINKLVQYERGT